MHQPPRAFATDDRCVDATPSPASLSRCIAIIVEQIMQIKVIGIKIYSRVGYWATPGADINAAQGDKVINIYC